MREFGNFPTPENAKGFDVASFKGYTTIKTYSRAQWDRMTLNERRNAFTSHHVHIKGPRAQPILRADVWDPEVLGSIVDVWGARQCHGKCTFYLSDSISHGCL